MFIANHLISATATGKRKNSFFTGLYKVRINNAVFKGKLYILNSTVIFADRSEVALVEL